MTIKWIADSAIGEMQKSGGFTRAASYGAGMINAYFLDQLLKEDPDSFRNDILDILAIENDLLPTLEALGFIGFFTIEEWMATDHLGRLAIALLYLRRHPEKIQDVEKRLEEVRNDPAKQPLLDLIPLSTVAVVDWQSRQASSASGLAVAPANLIPDEKQGWITSSGIFYRKGTSVATMENCRVYQQAIDNGVTDMHAPDVFTAVNDQQFITNMMACGIFFSFFPPHDWLQNEKKEGRMMPALLLLQQHPELIDATLQQKLEQLRQFVSPITANLIDDVLSILKNHEATRRAVQNIIRKSIDDFSSFLQQQPQSDFERKASRFLLPTESATVTSTRFGGTIRGVRNIIDAFKRHASSTTTPIVPSIEQAIYDIELTSGLALASMPFKNGDKTGSLVCQFRRTSDPSCLEVIRGRERDWHAGEWLIWTWHEIDCHRGHQEFS